VAAAAAAEGAAAAGTGGVGGAATRARASSVAAPRGSLKLIHSPNFLPASLNKRFVSASPTPCKTPPALRGVLDDSAAAAAPEADGGGGALPGEALGHAALDSSPRVSSPQSPKGLTPKCWRYRRRSGEVSERFRIISCRIWFWASVAVPAASTRGVNVDMASAWSVGASWDARWDRGPVQAKLPEEP